VVNSLFFLITVIIIIIQYSSEPTGWHNQLLYFCKNRVTNSTLGSQWAIRSLFHINCIPQYNARGS